MPVEHVEFQFKCPFCGGSVLELPEGYNDNSIATCGSCGSDIARWGDIKAQAEAMKPERESTPFKGFR